MENRKAHKGKFLDERTTIVKVILIIFFAVGVTGTAIELSRGLFIKLTPLALLLCLAALLAYHRSDSPGKDVLIFGTIFITGFLVETAGVNTGKIFGNYAYGEGLGIKLFNTPLLIGINWMALTYTTAIITGKIKAPAIVRLAYASALMVLYDLIMEQVAPVMRMWSFKDGIPVQNYIAWFVMAMIFHAMIKISGIRFTNRIAPFIFIIQGLFFIFLYIVFQITQ